MRKLLLSLAAVAALAGFTSVGAQAAPALPGAVPTAAEAPIVQVQMSERRMMRHGMKRRAMMRHHRTMHRRSMMKRHRMMHSRPMMHRRMRSM